MAPNFTKIFIQLELKCEFFFFIHWFLTERVAWILELRRIITIVSTETPLSIEFSLSLVLRLYWEKWIQFERTPLMYLYKDVYEICTYSTMLVVRVTSRNLFHSLIQGCHRCLWFSVFLRVYSVAWLTYGEINLNLRQGRGRRKLRTNFYITYELFCLVKHLIYDAVSVSKLFILAIAEFEFSHRWIILAIAKFDFSDGWIILAIAEFEFSHG